MARLVESIIITIEVWILLIWCQDLVFYPESFHSWIRVCSVGRSSGAHIHQTTDDADSGELIVNNLVAYLAMIPLFVILGYWINLYRRKRLTIRFMAVSSALSTFVGFLIIELVRRLSGTPSAIGFWESLLDISITSIGVGATFLLWWPILGRSLKKHTSIRWWIKSVYTPSLHVDVQLKLISNPITHLPRWRIWSDGRVEQLR